MKSKGITLISLVITIIILLILAGIVVNLSLEDNGIFRRAKQGIEEYKKSEIKEEIETAIVEIQSDDAIEKMEEASMKEEIFKNLPDKIENIIVNESLVGEYKNYEYWIDDNYVVHIGEKVNDDIKVSIETPHIGTSSVTVNVNAISQKSKIVKYQYEVNNEIKEETSQSSYTIENLDPETKYIISVTVIDEIGNSRSSIPKTIVTKGRTYLIKEGIEQIQGQIVNATAKNENDYLKILVNLCTYYRGGYYIDYDLSKYRKVKIDLEIANKVIGSTVMFGLDSGNNPAWDDFGICEQLIEVNETEKIRDVYFIDVEGLTKNYKIYILKNATATETGATFYIYNLWLEE